jgi:hypothetical protein
VRRLALVRHGRSSHVHAGWVDADGFRAWRAAYEAAGIRDDEQAPADLVRLAQAAGIVAASDAARTVASARLLAGGREVLLSPLLRELDLEGPGLGGARVPLALWALGVGGRALALRIRGRYPAPRERARVEAAAVWLETLSAHHQLVVAVTHAQFRQEVSARLMRAGWRAEQGRRTRHPWSTWWFSR